MKNKIITYKKYNQTINRYNDLKRKGIVPIIKRSTFKIGLGIACLIIALMPNGLMPVFMPLSFYLLGFSKKDIDNIKRKIKNRLR